VTCEDRSSGEEALADTEESASQRSQQAATRRSTRKLSAERLRQPGTA
jgi:hypothetical protein